MFPSAIRGTLAVLTVLAATLANAELSEAQRDLIERRACEAAIWGMPAVGIYDIELAMQRDGGAEFGTLGYMSAPMDSRHGFLTANDVTPYVMGALTTKDGPIVIEVPPAGEKAQYFGTIVNAWDTPMADVGPSGADKGKGGKYLLLPPDFEGEVPHEGYIVFRSDTYSVNFVFRPVATDGGTHADQAAYAQTLKWYPLAQAGDPPDTRFFDVYDNPINTLPVYDMTYFNDLNTVIQREVVLDRDKAMMGLLASIGIEKGKTFEPDEATQEALLKGLDCAYAAMQEHFVTKAVVPYWQGSQWQVWSFPEGQAESGFPFETDQMVLVDDRAGGAYFWITYMPKRLGGGTFYLTGLDDSDGNPLNGTDTYRLNVPADTPAKDFWSVIVYSMQTKGFVQGAERVGLASTELDQMTKNNDGSVDIFFAPEPPEGMASNWIPTGEDFFLLFRLYGPDKPLFEKTWVLDDVERLN